MQITPSIHRVGNDLAAAYLVVTDDGITAIDAGLGGYWRLLERELQSIGRSPAEIRGVILTHGDSDHLGYAERLRRDHGGPVYIHAADAERARTGKKPSTSTGPTKPLAVLRFAAYVMRHGATKNVHVAEVHELRGGETLPLPGAPEIVAVPGHSPGSIAVYVASSDALFVGDAITTRNQMTGEARVQIGAFSEDPAAAGRAAAVLAGRPASWILPGHGVPRHGTHAETARVLAAAATH